MISFRFFAIFTLTILLMATSVMVFSVDYEKTVKEYRRWVPWFVDEEGKTNLNMAPCGGSAVRRAASSLFASLLYLSVFVLIGLICSVFTTSPVISAVAFLLNWTFLVFVIPNLGGILIGVLESIQTPVHMKGIAETIPDKYPLRPGMSFEEEASVALQRERAREKLVIEYIQSLIQQVNRAQDLTRISPASVYAYAAENITGGGTNRLTHFINNVVRYREGFLRAMIEADREDPQSQHIYMPYRCGADNFSNGSELGSLL